jgi:hypothetical protein
LVIVSPDTVLRWQRRRFRVLLDPPFGPVTRRTPARQHRGRWRECLNHVAALGERHLRRTLARYFSYYHRARTHLSLDKDAPHGRPIERPDLGRVIPIREVGGLHHRYIRRAA